MKTIGYAAQAADSPLAPFSFDRRELRPNDILMEVLYTGICHTDLHQARNDWGFSQYPLVPGHEIVGRVLEVGSEVERYQIGDAVAVGCMVDSCQHCDQCRKGEEQLCREGNTQTYNSRDRLTGEVTFGGYSKHLVVREEFALRVPDGLDLSRTAPLLCAGITTYSPLRTWDVGPGRPRGRDRPRRAGPHGREAGSRPRRRSDGDEPVPRQGAGCAGAWGRPAACFNGCGRDDESAV